uniref:Uncharacterized protein n=1 Tax=Chromera velia CCMP2878 TaxID=1169474 RepID=A0A0G4H7S7_9ALVE|eukprot:Cvel_24993.t1-p1 / transcript=Cvel_24993.t1 / gene=Cvel_24993 / organism=Chromera_velia_CCMP2878 / gene_product=hypothetical protein / transcript_product=hypothetical protein / location=Cvel_scaffold2770:2425-2937(+) / protein_length=171 / sequence_SO=supercontig / SO=protein_coding / is_pseudo=false
MLRATGVSGTVKALTPLSLTGRGASEEFTPNTHPPPTDPASSSGPNDSEEEEEEEGGVVGLVTGGVAAGLLIFVLWYCRFKGAKTRHNPSNEEEEEEGREPQTTCGGRSHSPQAHTIRKRLLRRERSREGDGRPTRPSTPRSSRIRIIRPSSSQSPYSSLPPTLCTATQIP